jgi:hypothetical protein
MHLVVDANQEIWELVSRSGAEGAGLLEPGVRPVIG